MRREYYIEALDTSGELQQAYITAECAEDAVASMHRLSRYVGVTLSRILVCR